jgi:hypothetical protein
VVLKGKSSSLTTVVYGSWSCWIDEYGKASIWICVVSVMLQGVSLSLSAAPHSLLSPRRSLRVIYTGRITTFGNS